MKTQLHTRTSCHKPTKRHKCDETNRKWQLQDISFDTLFFIFPFCSSYYFRTIKNRHSSLEPRHSKAAQHSSIQPSNRSGIARTTGPSNCACIACPSRPFCVPRVSIFSKRSASGTNNNMKKEKRREKKKRLQCRSALRICAR